MIQSPVPPVISLGEQTFTVQSQLDFAAASGDRNPIHVDAVAARRLLSGELVVHGIHLMINALNRWQQRSAPGCLNVECHFINPVSVGDDVTFLQTDESASLSRITAAVNGVACIDMTIELRPQEIASPCLGGDATPKRLIRRIDELTAPLDEPSESFSSSVIELLTRANSLEADYPKAAAVLGRNGLSAVARLSYFVGMVCPGLHSVFSSVRFTLNGKQDDLMRFSVRKFDARFGLFIVDFDGSIAGELRAFVRPRPSSQPSAREVAKKLRGDEFNGTCSWVIGGSRGLGEITAKIIAAGGGDCLVSYANGLVDAQAVADDIAEIDRGTCRVMHLDLRNTFEGTIDVDPTRLDALYFFATPRIYRKRSERFDRVAFEEFVDFYLQRFYEICLWLERTERPAPLRAYLPSTVYIDDRPRGMTEYTMAKAAAEVLADDLNRSLRNVRIVHTRLPRLETDQTASIVKASVGSNFDAMLAVTNLMYR